jgi:ubiquinone/menaquinone biosynthesis C-methylase UbiE
MKESELKSIVDCMAASNVSFEVQVAQTKHRIKLVDFWGIQSGSKILEIGCGQGDTTAVLAYYTGEKGFVHGIDIGSPDYGSPVSLGESAEYLIQSRVGKQIRIDFNMDILSPEVDFQENSFDYIVFSHCSWYTKSVSELLRIMKKVKKWGKTLCFAEWSTTIQSIEQYPHLLSIIIQSQYEAFKHDSESNVRTLLTPKDLKAIIEQAGWRMIKDSSIDSPDLQDGKWEVDKVKSDFDSELNEINDMPDKLKDLIRSQVSMLEGTGVIKPLSVYCFIAD